MKDKLSMCSDVSAVVGVVMKDENAKYVADEGCDGTIESDGLFLSPQVILKYHQNRLYGRYEGHECRQSTTR